MKRKWISILLAVAIVFTPLSISFNKENHVEVNLSSADAADKIESIEPQIEVEVYHNMVKIKWGKVSGNQKYIIKRKKENGRWRKIKTVKEQYSFVDWNVDENTNYLYKVVSGGKESKSVEAYTDENNLLKDEINWFEKTEKDDYTIEGNNEIKKYNKKDYITPKVKVIKTYSTSVSKAEFRKSLIGIVLPHEKKWKDPATRIACKLDDKIKSLKPAEKFVQVKLPKDIFLREEMEQSHFEEWNAKLYKAGYDCDFAEPFSKFSKAKEDYLFRVIPKYWAYKDKDKTYLYVFFSESKNLGELFVDPLNIDLEVATVDYSNRNETVYSGFLQTIILNEKKGDVKIYLQQVKMTVKNK